MFRVNKLSFHRVLVFVSAIVLVALLVVGKSNASKSKKKIDIRGKITTIAMRDDMQVPLVILVEGVLSKSTNYDKASIKVTLDTIVKDKRTGKVLNSQYSSLKNGQKVESNFIGPVAESYPVQATAKEIVILSD